jgi:hypothetical protein
MATKDSQDELGQAFEAFQAMAGSLPKSDTLTILPGAPPNPPEGIVSSTIMPPAVPEGQKSAPPIYVDIDWIKGGDRWYINGKATLEAINARVEAIKKEKAAKK